MYYVYVLQSDQHLYFGVTRDLKKRVTQHNSGKSPSTKRYIPWTIIFYEAYNNTYDARRREKYFKTSQGKQAIKRMLRHHFENQGSTSG